MAYGLEIVAMKITNKKTKEVSYEANRYTESEFEEIYPLGLKGGVKKEDNLYIYEYKLLSELFN